MPPDPSRVERPSGLRQIYPPVTFKYPLAQKLIETPASTVPILYLHVSQSFLKLWALTWHENEIIKKKLTYE